MSAPPVGLARLISGDLADCLQVLLRRRRDDLVDAEIVGDAVDLSQELLARFVAIGAAMRHRPASFRPARWTRSRETVFAAIEWLESDRSLLDAERPAECRRQRPTRTLATAVDELGTGGNLSPAHGRRIVEPTESSQDPTKEGPRLSALLVNRAISVPEQISCHAHAALRALTPARASAVDPCLGSALSNSL
jgi:hypothetical protein